MVKGAAERRRGYFNRLVGLIEKYPRILIVNADNVGSKQMAELRCSLRGKATILMGKNTMIRTCLRTLVDKMPQVEQLIPEIRRNLGLVFCDAPTTEIRSIIVGNKVPAVARQGVIAPNDVIIPPGPTGLDPSQTNFFQALSIGTKIVKGQIEIQSAVELIKTGDRVTASQSTLLQKLHVRPFAYWMLPVKVYDDGFVYDAKVLDITDEDILSKFAAGVSNVAALSREIGMPTEASVSHCIVEAFKYCTALCIEAGDYTFPEMKKLREMIENPEAFAAAAPAAAAPAAAKAPEPEPESESEDDMGMGGLFD